MYKKLIKYRLIVIIFAIILCTFYVDSPFNGNYYKASPIFIYLLVTFFNLLIYVFPNDKLIASEKIFFSVLVSAISLVVAFFFIHLVLGYIYGYDTNYYDELKSPAILNSILFYSLSTALGIFSFAIWLKSKKPIYD